MSGLKIINSSDSRILTQCDHCHHVIKTRADALYYYVECPSCSKDFIVKRYKQPVARQRQKEIEHVGQTMRSSSNFNEGLFVRTVYKLSWPVYKILNILSFILGTFVFGFTGNFNVVFIYFLVLFALTILHYFVICTGSIYFSMQEKNKRLSSSTSTG